MNLTHLIHSQLTGDDLHIAKCNTGEYAPDFAPSTLGELYYDLRNAELYIATEEYAMNRPIGKWERVVDVPTVEELKAIFLSKDNVSSYEPKEPFNPATKRYVDNYFVVAPEEPIGLRNGLVWYDSTNDEIKYYFEDTFITVDNKSDIKKYEFKFNSESGKDSYKLPVEIKDENKIGYDIFVNGLRQPNDCIVSFIKDTIIFKKPLPGKYEIVVNMLTKEYRSW